MENIFVSYRTLGCRIEKKDHCYFVFVGWTSNSGGSSIGSSGGYFGGQQSQSSNLQKLAAAGCNCKNKVRS